MDLVGKQIGNYVAQRVLGRGGMGAVYLAVHPAINRKVAVKVLHEELAIDQHMVQRLWLEAKSASEIDSEHIVEVLDFGTLPLGMSAGDKRETVYLTMELLEGKSLADRFWEQGISFRESIAIARQICRALVASHKKGIIHRDLKPENVFLVERNGDPNFVKILDFGIAKLVQNPYSRTRTGVLLGTPAYMSPEQCRGSGEVDSRSDIYSLGVMLYELTSGVLPFAAVGFGDVLVAQMTQKPEPPSTHNPRIPKTLENAILCALEKKTDDRFQTMEAFSAALATIADEIDRLEEAHVSAAGDRHKTTERDAPGVNSPDQTWMDPPRPKDIWDLHALSTQSIDKSAGLHERSTHIVEGKQLSERETLIKSPEVEKRAPQAASDAKTLHEATQGELHQRLAGVSLKDALGGTGALHQLQAKLDARGAPQPLRPELPGALAVSDAEFLAAQRSVVRRRLLVVAAIVVGAMIGLFFFLR